MFRLFNEVEPISSDLWQNVVPRFTEAQFRRRFRVPKRAMRELGKILDVHTHPISDEKRGQVGRPSLVSGEDYLDVADPSTRPSTPSLTSCSRAS